MKTELVHLSSQSAELLSDECRILTMIVSNSGDQSSDVEIAISILGQEVTLIRKTISPKTSMSLLPGKDDQMRLGESQFLRGKTRTGSADFIVSYIPILSSSSSSEGSSSSEEETSSSSEGSSSTVIGSSSTSNPPPVPPPPPPDLPPPPPPPDLPCRNPGDDFDERPCCNGTPYQDLCELSARMGNGWRANGFRSNNLDCECECVITSLEEGAAFCSGQVPEMTDISYPENWTYDQIYDQANCACHWPPIIPVCYFCAEEDYWSDPGCRPVWLTFFADMSREERDYWWPCPGSASCTLAKDYCTAFQGQFGMPSEMWLDSRCGGMQDLPGGQGGGWDGCFVRSSSSSSEDASSSSTGGCEQGDLFYYSSLFIMGCCLQIHESKSTCLGIVIEEDCPVGKLINSEIVWHKGENCESCND